MIIPKQDVDYSLYLVTDSTMLPPGKTLYDQVKAGLENGVTLVQIREKDTDTKSFIEEGLEVRELCHQFNVPLIINDRVDVAMAIDADGVHVGQDDMPIPMVRKLLGPDKILGWSVGFVSEVEELAKWGPDMIDYIGVGTLFPTLTKKNPKKAPMGPQGASGILTALEDNKAFWCKTVAIGGLHPDCIERVIYQCNSSNGKRSIDGISLVSDIMASENAAESTVVLRKLIDGTNFKYVNFQLTPSDVSSSNIKNVISQVKASRPLVQHMTNKVHQNFGANVTLALGSSPIMSEVESEARDLAQIPQASLLVNTGSVAPATTLRTAIRAYNEFKRPIVFDPVGYSATETRLILNDTLLTFGQFVCIKGNSSEILSLAKMTEGKMKGVDAAGTDGITKEYLALATQTVAYKYKTIAVCTGETDFIADGTFAGKIELSNGTEGITAKDLPVYTIEDGPIPIMGDITASGCSLGSTIATLVGGLKEDGIAIDAVVGAVQLYKSAGKLASTRARGSGSFHVELIDALYQLFNENKPEEWTANVTRL
ncbi:thiamine biosynthetic bifunctional enzyme [Monosporozyma unispora]|nr:thiamine biosynthetic bifunctional enzyme [Kazachstania unispora]